MRTILFASMAAMMSVSGEAAAQVIFSETFDSVSPGLKNVGESAGQFRIMAGNIDVVGDLNGSYFNCPAPGAASNNCIDLNGERAGTLTTIAALDALAGRSYTVSFDLGSSPPSASDPLAAYTLQLSWGDYSQAFSIAPASPFSPRSFSFTAAQGFTSNLTITSTSLTSPTFFGPIIDNVSITRDAMSAVPEPATWAMLIGGMGIVGGAMRRRRARTISLA